MVDITREVMRGVQLQCVLPSILVPLPNRATLPHKMCVGESARELFIEEGTERLRCKATLAA